MSPAPEHQAALFARPVPAEPAEPTPRRLVRVVVERGIEGSLSDAGDAGLTYACDDERVSIGDRVEVPLGRGDTPAGGVVVAVGGAELLPNPPPARIKRVLSRSGARLPASLIDLARWIARYYVCPLGMVLATMMPAAVKQGVGRRSRVVLSRANPEPAGAAGALKPAARSAWEVLRGLDEGAFPAEPGALRLLAGCKTLGPINQLVATGLLTAAMDSFVRAASRDLLPTLGDDAGREPPALTPDQARADAGIAGSLGSFATHLLFGVTGSGKTEVYLRLIRRVLDSDPAAGVIVLVPEIALTPQTSERFRRRLAPEPVVTLHSGLSEGERHRDWSLLAAGRARVVIGARSALFAPVERLGLIVVDEEHDPSYKQDQLPRYHARDAAIKRASLAACPVVLGSATPSLESWANAKAGRSTLWELRTRPGVARLPRVEIVDLAEEMKADPALRAGAQIGPRLERALRATLARGGQAILLLNRRGYSSCVGCTDRTCGWVLRCDSCSAAMVFHKDTQTPRGGLVRCHHCLAERLRPEACPDCGKRVRGFGAGTQRAEEEIEARFADLGLVRGVNFERVDSDAMRGAPAYHAALARFSRGELRLLVGTQMIAKGLDFPNVELVGVVNADTSLWLPDFRAAERTFQLVCQVAGRAGRSDRPGLVLVQTLSPDSSAIVHASAHRFVAFAEEELTIRREAHLPPATRIARIVCRDKDAARADEHAAAIRAALEPALDSGSLLALEGPAPCVVERAHDHFRVEVRAVAADAPTLARVLDHVRRAGVLTSDHATAVDVDPTAML